MLVLFDVIIGEVDFRESRICWPMDSSSSPLGTGEFDDSTSCLGVGDFEGVTREGGESRNGWESLGVLLWADRNWEEPGCGRGAWHIPLPGCSLMVASAKLCRTPNWVHHTRHAHTSFGGLSWSLFFELLGLNW
jgi:hypothetical protein